MKILYDFADKQLHKNLKKYLDAVFSVELLAGDGIQVRITDNKALAGNDTGVIVLSDSAVGMNVISLPVRRGEVADAVRAFISR